MIVSLYSLCSCRYCVGARLKFWRRRRVPKKGSRDEAVEIRLYNKFEFTGDRRHISCRNRVVHFQWVFPTSRGIFSLLLGGLNTSASREQPGERPTFRMMLLRDDSVTKCRCQAFSPFNFRPGLDPVFFVEIVLLCCV